MTFFQQNRTLYVWAGLIGTVLIVPMGVSIYQFLQDDGKRLALNLGTLGLLVGAAFLIGWYMTDYFRTSLNEANIAEPTLEAFEAVLTTSGLVTIIIGSSLTMAVGTGLISVAGIRSRLVPKWLAWFGLVVGVLNITWLGFFWLPGFRPGEALFFIPFVAYGLSLVWQVILGVIMMRYRAPEAVLKAELQTS